jgi:hypothetical protein
MWILAHPVARHRQRRRRRPARPPPPGRPPPPLHAAEELGRPQTPGRRRGTRARTHARYVQRVATRCGWDVARELGLLIRSADLAADHAGGLASGAGPVTSAYSGFERA